MQVRSEFTQYVAQRTKLSPEQVEAKAFSFDMDTGVPEDRLAGTAETMEQFLDMAKNGHRKMESAPARSEKSTQYFQMLFNSLPKDPETLAGDPSKPNSVLFGLRAKASEELNFGVREVGAKEQQDGMFWAPLHQEVVEIDDFASDSPAQTRTKALLFVDTTPGVAGGTAFIQPLVPMEPKLSEADKVSDTGNSVAEPSQVRPQVSAKLDTLLEADQVSRSQPTGSSNNDFFYNFYQGGEKTAVVRLGSDNEGGMFSPIVPGITDMESTGVVSIAQHADQEYAEHIELNGEERKALLATLSQANNALPEPPNGQLLDETQQRQWQHKQMLGAATTTLSALVADGNLGFYESLVSDLDLSSSWLARLKAGESPSRVF
jgi:hypothetical protein